jgi:pimeloyl-ACP methyl ester carboxylesterase
MRARLPDLEGEVVRDGLRIAYEVYENSGPTILLLPTWALFNSRHWKAQIPFLARHFRVVTYDGPGNGKSDRPVVPSAYDSGQRIEEALAVLDATSTDRAFVAGVSSGGAHASALAGLHPERVLGAILIGTASWLGDPPPDRYWIPFDAKLDRYDGWDKYNMHYWSSNYRDFTEFFVDRIYSEPHSTKQWEDGVGWANETNGEVLIATQLRQGFDEEKEREVLAAIRCPVLLIHGTADRVQHYSTAEAIAAATGGSLLLIEGGGHCPQARDPVVVNRAIREFVDRVSRAPST